jgi:C4-type Zn-finger protein
MIECPMCHNKFKYSAKYYKSFYFKRNGEIKKGAYKERRCPYCGYVLSVKKIDKIPELKFKPSDFLKKFREEIDEVFKRLEKIFYE